MIEFNEKKYIVKLIDDIKDKKHLIYLYKIILEEKIKHTRNKNGIFFSLNNIEDDKLLKIKNYLYSI